MIHIFSYIVGGNSSLYPKASKSKIYAYVSL